MSFKMINDLFKNHLIIINKYYISKTSFKVIRFLFKIITLSYNFTIEEYFVFSLEGAVTWLYINVVSTLVVIM